MWQKASPPYPEERHGVDCYTCTEDRMHSSPLLHLTHMVIIEAFLGEGGKGRQPGTHLVKETHEADLLVATLVIS